MYINVKLLQKICKFERIYSFFSKVARFDNFKSFFTKKRFLKIKCHQKLYGWTAMCMIKMFYSLSGTLQIDQKVRRTGTVAGEGRSYFTRLEVPLLLRLSLNVLVLSRDTAITSKLFDAVINTVQLNSLNKIFS